MTTTDSIRVGVFPPFDLLARGPATAASYLSQVEDAGLDHVCCADHVSFAGAGFDGLVQATALAALHPRLPVHMGVYLLPLRHPVLVARQLADLDAIAPGRLVFGVGIGGEDRHEVEICGVDPASRGRRMEESLSVLRALMTGAPVTFHGEFFDIEEAVIRPSASVPIVIGGRSDQAIRRAGRHGDGWLGIWNSPRRFAQAVEMVAEEAAQAGRTSKPHRHAMQDVRALLSARHPGRRRHVPRALRGGGLP
jgi:alkanesulfonate monooxygenase SsuD/methylene tetrahydromethanopterin reductase-like flavin-dependent oxidoreductase (luciferase family)